MKILQLHTKMVSGGIEAVVCNLSNELSKTHDVTLCTIFQPTEQDVFYQKLSDKVKKITIGKKHVGFSIKEIWKIYRVVQKGKYDVVHVHGCFQYYFFTIARLHPKVRFVYTVHSDANKENQTWDWRLFKLKRYMFVHRWMLPVTISEASQQSFAALYHCESTLIHNGIAKGKVNASSKSVMDKLRKAETLLLRQDSIYRRAKRCGRPHGLCRCVLFALAVGRFAHDFVRGFVGGLYPHLHSGWRYRQRNRVWQKWLALCRRFGNCLSLGRKNLLEHDGRGARAYESKRNRQLRKIRY